MNNKTLAKSIIVLSLICLVISAALAIVNSFTAPIIAEGKVERETESRQEVLPEADEFKELSLDKLPESVTAAYQGLDDKGETVGYVFTAGNKGFGGTITVMCAIATDGTIVGVSTMDVTSETTTLGGQTANPEYTNQYIGEDSSLSDVDTISGATITSTAYQKCVSDCFTAYDTVKEG